SVAVAGIARAAARGSCHRQGGGRMIIRLSLIEGRNGPQVRPAPSPQPKSDVSDFGHSKSAELGQARVRMGEGGGEGVTIERLVPRGRHCVAGGSGMFRTLTRLLSGRTRVNPSSTGERESRRAGVGGRALPKAMRERERDMCPTGVS